MALEQNTSHREEAIALLLYQLKGKPRLEVVVGALGTQVQEIEDALWDLLLERGIESGVGTQLDGIGEIVGKERGGIGDSAYRCILRAWVKVLRSSGTSDQLIEIVRLSQNDADFALTLTEPDPATIRIVLDEPLVLGGGGRIKRLFRLLVEAKSGGVKLFLEGTVSEFDDVFSFGDVPTETGSSNGWGDTADPDVGGEFVAAFAG